MFKKISEAFVSASESGVLSSFIKLIAFIGLAIWLSNYFVEPDSPHLTSLILNIKGFGGIALCFYGLFGCAEVMALRSYEGYDDGCKGFLSFLNKMTIFYCVLLGVVVAIGQHGDAILIRANTDPVSLAIGVASVLFLVISLFVAEWMNRKLSLNYHGMSARYAVASGGSKKSVSEPEIVNTAVHEAGHFICLGALPDFQILPEHFEVKVKHTIRSNDDVAGYVSGITFKNTSKSILEFGMLKALAGQAAERYVFKRDSGGSSTDLQRWEGFAKQYLRAYGDEEGLFYYREPQNAAESAHNGQVLIELQNKQREILRGLFGMNHALLNEVVDALYQSETIDRASAIEFLGRVSLPEDFSVPLDKNPAELLPENQKQIFADKTATEL